MTGNQVEQSPGLRFRARAARRETVAGSGRHQRLHGTLGRGHGVPALYLSGGGVAANSLGAGPGDQHHGRRADRSSAHYRRDRSAAAGGHRYRLGRRIQHSPDHAVDDQGGRGGGAYRGPGVAPSAAATGHARSLWRPARWQTASRLPWMPGPTTSLWSWRGPMRWPTEGLAAAIERAQAYVAAGADMIFAEAVTEAAVYSEFRAKRWVCPSWPTSRSSASDAAVYARRACRGGRRHHSVLLCGLPRDECGGSQGV
jgi:methylisocitrate lyase